MASSCQRESNPRLPSVGGRSHRVSCDSIGGVRAHVLSVASLCLLPKVVARLHVLRMVIIDGLKAKGPKK